MPQGSHNPEIGNSQRPVEITLGPAGFQDTLGGAERSALTGLLDRPPSPRALPVVPGAGGRGQLLRCDGAAVPATQPPWASAGLFSCLERAERALDGAAKGLRARRTDRCGAELRRVSDDNFEARS
jgi:hypothetical protein